MATKTIAALAGGLAGAAAVTTIHETIRRQDPKAPRMDKLGMESLSKILKKADSPVPEKQSLFWLTLAGDLVGNALYYSLTGTGGRKRAWPLGGALGLAAGIGAVLLPKPMGLDPANSNKTRKTQALSIAYYLIGGLVASAVVSALDKAVNSKK